MEKYIGNYLLLETFEKKVYKNVSLIAMNTLKGMIDAVRYFQKSNFLPYIDNVDVEKNGIMWQKHSTLNEAIKNNQGCCASGSQIVNSFLSKHYKHVGYFCFFNEDGNGHITTYVYTGGYYYFVDSIMLRNDSIPFFQKESKNLDITQCGDFTGYCYKAKSFSDFIEFYRCQKEIRKQMVPFCFYSREKCTATGLFTLPKKDDVKILFVDKNVNINIKIANF